MNFSEAMEELLAGKTIRRISKKRWEERDEPEEFIRDISIVDGRFRFVAWQKKRGEDGEFWVEDALVQNPASQGDSAFFSIDEVLAEDWYVVGTTHPAASALQALNEGKWVRHKTWDRFIRRREGTDDYECKFDAFTKGGVGKSRAFFPHQFRDYYSDEFESFFRKPHGWIISDKEVPNEFYSGSYE